MNLLKKARRTTASIAGTLATLLFLDFTGTLHAYLGWMAKIQFLPALLALNAGVVIGLLLITLLWGRIYCSVLCPLGVFQDVVSHSRPKRNRFGYSRALRGLRYGVLTLFVAAVAAGVGSVVALIEPYSMYGRMVSTLVTPLWQWGNNVLALLAEQAGSYAFYETDVWIKGLIPVATAIITLSLIGILAWRGGRTYCNTICPVGTVLGFVSRFSLYKHRIDREQCNSCGLCARNCKSSCIDPTTHTIDYSRCVTCFNCIGKCNKGAIRFSLPDKKTKPQEMEIDGSRRSMITAGALFTASVVRAQGKKVDGGLAFIEDKKIPHRQTPIVPPGAQGERNFSRQCTACQLCISACPNQVLRPSTRLDRFMQPEVSFERGYCRPECTKCSEVCPSGAIVPITKEDKSSTQVGHAVWVEQNCVVLTDGEECTLCTRQCPTAAITLVEREAGNGGSPKIPIVNIERCIGCGACEHLCPARPFSALYVEGHTQHRMI